MAASVTAPIWPIFGSSGHVRPQGAEAIDERLVREVRRGVRRRVVRVRTAVEVREMDRQRRRARRARIGEPAIAHAGGDVRGDVALRDLELVVEAAGEQAALVPVLFRPGVQVLVADVAHFEGHVAADRALDAGRVGRFANRPYAAARSRLPRHPACAAGSVPSGAAFTGAAPPSVNAAGDRPPVPRPRRRPALPACASAMARPAQS